MIRPEDCGFEVRGGGNATRQIIDILPPAAEADRLLVCEVLTPAGNWSSYPPHKHDQHKPPVEADLEETYYYRFRGPDGYGIQRLYTSEDRDGAGRSGSRTGTSCWCARAITRSSRRRASMPIT